MHKNEIELGIPKSNAVEISELPRSKIRDAHGTKWVKVRARCEYG